MVLVLVDPWLARSAGFALSALATAGILLLVPLAIVVWRQESWRRAAVTVGEALDAIAGFTVIFAR